MSMFAPCIHSHNIGIIFCRHFLAIHLNFLGRISVVKPELVPRNRYESHDIRGWNDVSNTILNDFGETRSLNWLNYDFNRRREF